MLFLDDGAKELSTSADSANRYAFFVLFKSYGHSLLEVAVQLRSDPVSLESEAIGPLSLLIDFRMVWTLTWDMHDGFHRAREHGRIDRSILAFTSFLSWNLEISRELSVQGHMEEDGT